MTKQEKLAIENLRKENYSYAFIASKLDLNANTVKSYCKRHNINPTCSCRKKKADKEKLQICLNCGTPITNDWNRCVKRFCSDKCRTAFWNAHKSKNSPSLVAAEEGPELPERTGLPAAAELSSDGRR